MFKKRLRFRFIGAVIAAKLSLLAATVAFCANFALAAEPELPTGYDPGLVCEFFATGRNLTAVPDVLDWTPASVCMITNVNVSATEEAWPGAPTNLTDRFATRITGCVWVPESDNYAFTLKSDDGSACWIDGSVAVAHDGRHGFTSRTSTIPLSAGLHAIEIRHFDNSGSSGLQLSWARTGEAAELVPPERFFHANGIDTDTDGDSLPDWWEELYGYDPFVADDATLDTDGDGLTDYEEFIHGSSPFSADTDSDGMPDEWEVSHGQHPAVADAITDKDCDGLAAIEEYRAGTDPRLADTDGDGIGDYVEVMELGSDPNSVDSVSLGNSAESTVDADGSFVFNVSTPGIFAFDATIVQRWVAYGKDEGTPRTTTNHAKFFVDGHCMSYREIAYDVSNAVHVVFYTPVLSQGGHSLRVALRHHDYRIRAFVSSASIRPVSGVDPVEAAWRRNSIPSASVSSRVSPAFVEGGARFPWLVSSATCEVKRGAADTWYADVQLAPLDSTSLDLTFEGVASTNVVVSWEETNLFDGAEDVSLRRGSSLLFAGLPPDATNGVVTVFTNGIVACEYGAGEYAALAFESDGVYEVDALWTDGEDGEVESPAMSVECMGGSFPDAAPACIVERARAWECPDMTTNCVMETDLRTHIAHSHGSTWTLLADDTRGERVVTARVSANGAILDSARLNPFWAVDSYGNACYIVKTNETRTLCRTCLVQGWSPEDVSFRVRPYSSSVTFEDLSIEKWYSALDFNAYGCKWFNLSIPNAMASPCHLVHVYQGGVLIGEAVYSDAAIPNELK